VPFLAAWTFRDRWGFTEVRTYECPVHGPIFVSPRAVAGHDPTGRPGTDPAQEDRDSLIPAPRKPRPPLGVDAIALPEPDFD
jgi:hypothetical protein